MPPPGNAPPRPLGEAGISVCVVQNGQVRILPRDSIPDEVYFDSAKAREWRARYPNTAEHAAGTAWFVNHEPVLFRTRNYTQYGLPRVMEPRELVPVGSFRGVTVFVSPKDAHGRPEVLYLPVNAFCEFQTYQDQTDGGPVGGRRSGIASPVGIVTAGMRDDGDVGLGSPVAGSR